MFKPLSAIFILVIIVTAFSYLLGACRKYPSTKDLEVMQQVVPDGFPQPVYTFGDNPLTKEGFELGRKLFYDGRLSIDNMHSCASCHQQIGAFGTYDHDRSHGVNNSHTLRNAPVLFNLSWNTSFHWDGQFNSLVDEAVHPINGQTEMGETFEGVIDKLEKDDTYRDLFRKVYRYPAIRPEFVLKSLAQFTGYITSANSKYDRFKKGLATFTPEEQSGYQFFQANCATCHPEPLFTDYSFRNTGMTIFPDLNDYGRMRITGKKEDSLKFKVPTLRNVNLSNNYMHDGRFNTLAQCLNHYRSGVQVSTTLDPSLINGIPMTDVQATQVIAFLKTLSDSSILNNSMFSKPQ